MTPLLMLETPSTATGTARLWATDRGPVWVESHASVDTIRQLAVDPEIGTFAHYGTEAARRQKETLLWVPAMRGGNAVIAHTLDQHIVGYICLAAPAPEAHWTGPDLPAVLEFGLLEVSRGWRRVGLAAKLMEAAFGEDAVEDRIIVAPCYTWHWDLARSGLDKWRYRTLLRDLMTRQGFVELETDEENICFDEANLLMARIGSRVPADQVARFHGTLFQDQF